MNQRPTFASPDFAVNRLAMDDAFRRPQSFGRFEFKYILSGRIRSLLEHELRDFMEVDPFCRDRPGQTYLVRSLYFDDPAFQDYYEKTDGLLMREKYRLRTYDEPGTAPCFLEIKGRQNHFSYKHRTLLDPHTANLIAGQRWSALAHAKTATPVTRRFAAAACRRNLGPQVAVEYVRRPYVSRRDYRFRATFDSEIRGLRSRTLTDRAVSSAVVLRGLTVLEIKFEHAVPAWFQRLVGAYELQRISISKYCRAAEALTVVQNLE